MATEWEDVPPEPLEIPVTAVFLDAPVWTAAIALPEGLLPRVVEPEAENAPPAEAPLPPMPEPGFLPVELHCRNKAGTPSEDSDAGSLPASPALPAFSLPVALESLEDLAAGKPPKRPPDSAALAPASHHRKVSATTSLIIKAVAAGIVVAVSVWFGLGTLRTSSPEVAVAGAAGPGEARQSGPAIVMDAAPAGAIATGPVAWVRGALAARAAVEFHDSFRNGMKAWESASGTKPAGWAHRALGYVQPGPLALFRPSLGFTNYRFEFFGQIEEKSMGWVVRAQDARNYYAMKVKVVEPGLRPIIAIEHYPVVAGKRGHRVEVPLNVMVHNDMPYHVAVLVKDNHVITSIEGQEVDTWTDDSLAQGGVGFFADAGEAARLYWMRLTRNQDVWGRVCAYLSSGSGPAPRSAALWPHQPALPFKRRSGAAWDAACLSNRHSSRQRMEAWKC